MTDRQIAIVLTYAALLYPLSAMAVEPFQKFDSANCSKGSCTANFGTVPQGKILNITNVSCSTVFDRNLDPIDAVRFAQIQADSTILSYVPTVEDFATSENGDFRTLILLSSSIYVEAGKQIKLIIIGRTKSANCSLNGQILNK